MIKESDIDNLIIMAAEFYGVPEEKLKTTDRKGQVPEVRQICMYILHEKWKINLKSTARIFGYTKKGNHTLVLRACKIVNGLIEVNREFRVTFDTFFSEVEMVMPQKKTKKITILKESLGEEDKEEDKELKVFEDKISSIQKKIDEWKKLKKEINQEIRQLENLL